MNELGNFLNIKNYNKSVYKYKYVENFHIIKKTSKPIYNSK